MGFLEVELGFPSANQAEFDFIRHIVDTPGLVPDNVKLRVLVPCREEAIKRGVESLQGAKQAVLFTYLASSNNYRSTVLGLCEEEWLDRARTGTAYARSLTKDDPMAKSNTQWHFGFGFEDFANARPSAVAKCAQAIIATWEPTIHEPLDIGLATSIESTTPNVFADKVEYICSTLGNKGKWQLSVHTHNDRGGAVATAELALLAGADKVEGCLFGNGERAGNLDLVTLSLNLVTQGIDPGIDLSDLAGIRDVYESTTGQTVLARAPYAGELCLMAFSGAHQDAIAKGLRLRHAAAEQSRDSWFWPKWQVPYMPIDPVDIGSYWDDVVGLSSHSGKEGIFWFIKKGLGLTLPLELARFFSTTLKTICIARSDRLTLDEASSAFLDFFGIPLVQATSHLFVEGISAAAATRELCRSLHCTATHQLMDIDNLGKDASAHLQRKLGIDAGAQSQELRIAYVRLAVDGKPEAWGVGYGRETCHEGERQRANGVRQEKHSTGHGCCTKTSRCYRMISQHVPCRLAQADQANKPQTRAQLQL